jgi:FkbM family methyltransferase
MSPLIEKVLRHQEFKSKPPVFVDLGASGGLPKSWEVFAPYSVAVAFDADTRNFKVEDSNSSKWHRLIKINRIVIEGAEGAVDFYLTKSPGCSSSLSPDNESLEPWLFADLFEVVEVANLPSVSLATTLAQERIDYVDWIKLDTQGTDLRIFASLSDRIRREALVVEFEPGIMDAYKGEDKLHQVLEYMDSLPFFLSDMKVLGAKRLSRTNYASLQAMDGERDPTLKISPGWVEMTYLNDLGAGERSVRDLLLAWVFATMHGQHGHAMWVAQLGFKASADPQFRECELASINELRRPDYSKLGLRSLVVFCLIRVRRVFGRK